MANSVLRKKAREYVYRDGDNFFMRKYYLEAEVMLQRQIMNAFYSMEGFEFYPETDARDIIDELWAEMVETGRALE